MMRLLINSTRNINNLQNRGIFRISFNLLNQRSKLYHNPKDYHTFLIKRYTRKENNKSSSNLFNKTRRNSTLPSNLKKQNDKESSKSSEKNKPNCSLIDINSLTFPSSRSDLVFSTSLVNKETISNNESKDDKNIKNEAIDTNHFQHRGALREKVEKLGHNLNNNDVDEWVVETELEPKHEAVHTDQRKPATKPVEESGLYSKSFKETTKSDRESKPKNVTNNTEPHEKDIHDNEKIRHLGAIKETKDIIRNAKIALGGSIHPFNSIDVLNKLEESGIETSKSQGLMWSIRDILLMELAKTSEKVATKADIEDSSYKIKADLHQLRIEMLMVRKNGQSLLVSESATIARDLERMSQKIKDETGTLRAETSIEMNSLKYERNDLIKKIEIARQEMQTRHYVLLGDLRTEIESTKLQIIRWGLSSILITGVLIILFMPETKKKVVDTKPEEIQEVYKPREPSFMVF
ncbi:hypothetical protein BB559_000074 [Furculomyces boomerangus]|uniref:DUF1640 domain-containing protein n=2 Tax=Harpellales TaxID=61421 RepID=A0A2T9Z6C6_9FUNG|nr:hypothetical protein BB559_000074 [Furculomyces boomerangus]PWA00628.1 hypothetical protein BB558_003322 [Smittium angustum]